MNSVGLGKWHAAFREHGITRDQLGVLTEADLRELGLTIGERKRFLQALADHPVVDNALAPAPAAGPAVTRPERRPLTVMFVDLVDSTGIGERLHGEDLIEMTRRYREFCGAAVAKFGGHVERFMGDGILAYFCYPTANENDPERAVRAALTIVRGLGGVATPAHTPLKARIGLATGRVIVSDLAAGGAPDPHAILGSTPNLAARVQSLSPPNGIIISESTFARIHGLFDCEPVGEEKLKGFDQALRLWRVLREKPRRGFRLSERPRSLTGFHGRAYELNTLRMLWTEAERGEGKVVLVVGEAGIGKSRLIAQLTDVHLPFEARVIRLACSALDADTPFWPLIEHLRAIAGLTGTEEPSESLVKLESVLLGDEERRRQSRQILGALIGLPVDDPDRAKLQPGDLREQTIAVLVEELLLLAQRHPICLVVEDLHWLDPTTQEVLERLVQSLPSERVLMVLTARPTELSNWAALADTTLRLDRLKPDLIADMLGDLFAGYPVPPLLQREVIDRTDGVPLFVEEVGRLLLARAGRPVGESSRANDLADSEIPASLDELLMARLDQSGADKDIAQAAAVLGRSIRRDVLAAVCAVSAEALEQALAALVATGVLDPGAAPMHNVYRFHHALLQETAYASLLRDRRRELHARAAEALQELDPDLVELHPEILAWHLTEGSKAEEAAPHWLEAARRSLSRSALTEATRQLQRGLAALTRVPTSPANLSLRLQMSALLGPALIGLRGPMAAETQELYAAALELCEATPEEDSHFPIRFGWWRLSPDFHTHIIRAESLLERAVQRADPGVLLQAHHCSWASNLNTGRFDRCCEHIESGLAIYHSADYRHHARLYGNHDAKACAHGILSQLRWMQGRFKSALSEEAQALAWANEIGHLGSRVHTLDLTLLHRVYRRDLPEVLERAGELLSFTREHGIADHGAAGLVFQGWVIALKENAAAGLKLLEEGFARQREIVTAEDFPVYLCLLAEALMAAGRADEAVERIEKERLEFERIGLAVWMPELLRVLGDTVLASDPHADIRARKLYAEAEAMAMAQDVPMLGLRVAMSEARLALRTGNSEGVGARLCNLLRTLPEQEGQDFKEAHRLVSALDKAFGSVSM